MAKQPNEELNNYANKASQMGMSYGQLQQRETLARLKDGTIYDRSRKTKSRYEEWLAEQRY